MNSVTYRRRRSAISKVEREWRVEEGALATRGLMGRERRLPWTEIESVRLCSAPKPHQPWRHIFEIRPRHGRRIVIDNSHFTGRGAFEDRSDSFTPFVRAATARLAVANPKARARVGDTPLHYFLVLFAALIILGGVAFALIAFPTPLDSLPYAPLLKLGVVLVMLPLFASWVIGAAPRKIALDAIPQRALPRCSGDGVCDTDAAPEN